MPRARWLAELALVLAPCALALAPCGLVHAEGEVGRAIVRGKETRRDAAVLALLTTSGRLGCTGTLIRRHVILTAAHCVSTELGEPASVFIGRDLDVKGQALPVGERLVHPEFEAASLSADIALLGIEGELDLTPLELAEPPAPSKLPGLAVRVVGFGCTDLADDTQGVGVRRSRDDVIATKASDNKFRHADSTCRGDSGGPVLVEQAGDERILAVTSSGGAKDGMPFSLATDVATFRAWIDAQADDLDAILTPTPPEEESTQGCTVGVLPSPSEVGAFWPLFLGFAVARRLRRAIVCRP